MRELYVRRLRHDRFLTQINKLMKEMLKILRIDLQYWVFGFFMSVHVCVCGPINIQTAMKRATKHQTADNDSR